MSIRKYELHESSDSRSEVDIAVPARKPASRGGSATGMAWIAIIVLLPVGQRGERLQQRSHGNGRVGMIPARGQSATRACIQQQKRDVATGEVAGQRLGADWANNQQMDLPARSSSEFSGSSSGRRD